MSNCKEGWSKMIIAKYSTDLIDGIKAQSMKGSSGHVTKKTLLCLGLKDSKSLYIDFFVNIERHLDILEGGTILELEQCRLGSITQVESLAVQLNSEGRLVVC